MQSRLEKSTETLHQFLKLKSGRYDSSIVEPGFNTGTGYKTKEFSVYSHLKKKERERSYHTMYESHNSKRVALDTK